MVSTPDKKSKVKPRIYHQKKQSLQDVVPLDTPFSVHIDICSLCNFKCTFCFQHDKKGMKESGVKWGMMEVSTFKKCVDDLKKLILQLPNDQKEVINMRLYKDMSFKEISDITGVSINTALGRMRYAIINLRKIVEKNKIILEL